MLELELDDETEVEELELELEGASGTANSAHETRPARVPVPASTPSILNRRLV